MKYSFTATLLFAGLAAAQIPSCAQPCLDDAVKSSTTCGATDVACQCEPANKAAIQGAATSCVLGACGATEALAVLDAANKACEAAGSGSGSSSAPASSEAATSAASSVLSSYASSETSSVEASETGSSPTSAATGSVTTAVTPPSTTGHSNGTVTTPPIQVTGNSANNLVAGAGSIFAIGAAVLAAF